MLQNSAKQTVFTVLYQPHSGKKFFYHYDQPVLFESCSEIQR